MRRGYDFTRDDLPFLLLQLYFPEITKPESDVIHDFLEAHGTEFSQFSFSVRVGQGQTPDPTHLEGVQRNAVFTSRKRIDLEVWAGAQASLVEVKVRVTPGVLGQLRTYRQLWVEEHAGALEPRLLAIGRYSDEDTLRVLSAEGVDVYLYDIGVPREGLPAQ